jgi:U4/U6 small nuclear ribonucleoprotein PRP3
MTGCAIMTPHHNIVVVEGGPKNMRKYKRLMLQRINWNEKGKANHTGVGPLL